MRADTATIRTEPIVAITDAEFGLFQSLIERAAGIHLAPTKRALLCGRLSRRLRELGVASFGDYYRRVVEDETRVELAEMLDRIATNETHFFREPSHWELIANQIAPDLRRLAESGAVGRHVRAWSAGCSTGEEPYSLSMALQDHFPAEAGWTHEIVATDLSRRALAAAREGEWGVEKAREIPPRLLKRFMLRGTGASEGRMRADDAARAPLRFQNLNLNDERYPIPGAFRLIFCRNVLIYFEPAARVRVLERLASALEPGGYLFLGHAETLNGRALGLVNVIPTVFRKSRA